MVRVRVRIRVRVRVRVRVRALSTGLPSLSFAFPVLPCLPFLLAQLALIAVGRA
jgi:hypothetical protein